MIKKGVFNCNDQETTIKLCESCLLRKRKKLPCGSQKHSSKRPLDYCHSDLWGHSPYNSIGGGRYFLSIIDDFSMNVWVWILRKNHKLLISLKHGAEL